MGPEELGPWAPLPVANAVRLFRPASIRWWLTGGHALEAHLGRSWRTHDDTDIGISRQDAPQLRSVLQGWDIHIAAGGALTPWDGLPLEPDRSDHAATNLWCRPSPDEAWALDVTIGEGDNDQWIYRRDPTIRLAWNKAILTSRAGVPYLAPELQLLFKAKNPRPKDDLDAATLMPELSPEQHTWLLRHLPPNHPWGFRRGRLTPSSLYKTIPMSILRYITHPSVNIDPNVPVPRWGLSEKGRRQTQAMLRQPWVASIGRIVSSGETKALETAEILAAHLGLTVEVRPGTGENDRSATGFVPPDEFERLADTFFAQPEVSIQGWERAVDAQARIVSGLADLLDPATQLDQTTDNPATNISTATDIAVIGHGGVGTLWYCHLTGKAINRKHDQPGQGHYFSADLVTSSVLHAWQPIDGLGQ